jgi:hypothetical protein
MSRTFERRFADPPSVVFVRKVLVSSGRASVDVRLEMIQGTHAETLGVHRVPPPEVRELPVELLQQQSTP